MSQAPRKSYVGQRFLPARHRGFTILETVVAVAIIMTIAAISIPYFERAMYITRVSRAVGDIGTLQVEIDVFRSLNGRLPDTLDEIGRGNLLDPWHNSYQYLNFSKGNCKGQMRKDRFLVPLNSSYDLYSMGKDGQSVPPLTAQVSQDDILRANDGAFVGLASQF